MFCITLKFKQDAAPWTLLYKNEATAVKWWDAYIVARASSNPGIAMSDDFGQSLLVDPTCVAGSMFEDLDKSMLAHIERGLHNARTQAKAQQIALNDPVLKTAAMTRGQQPGIFDPQANRRFQG